MNGSRSAAAYRVVMLSCTAILTMSKAASRLMPPKY